MPNLEIFHTFFWNISTKVDENYFITEERRKMINNLNPFLANGEAPSSVKKSYMMTGKQYVVRLKLTSLKQESLLIRGREEPLK